MTTRPLDGVRVLDFTRVLSGPHATRMLCDLGADVIKVEAPDGDITRTTNPRVNGLATYFVQQNAGKRTISLDTAKPESVELLLRLAERCDVMIENFRPGVLDRIGLGYQAVTARHPAIVYASISGYGSSGPWAGRRAYAPVVGAETGITKEQGDRRDGQYANDPFSHADVYTALEAASAILAALFNRSRTGRGDRIEVSMAETMLYVNEHAHDQLWDREVPPEWIRSFEPAGYPVLAAANGETVIISGHPAERGTFERYMSAIERLDLIDDPRFADLPSRRANFAELLELIAAWAAKVANPQLIELVMGRYGLATGTLRSLREVCETDWAEDRGAVVEVSDRGDGTVRLPNTPWRFASADVSLRGEPRYRGEDNRTVLAELLGLDDSELDRLEADGVLSSRLPAAMTLRYPVTPMKAAIGNLPADDENWAFEIKWDGYRTLAFVDDGRTRLQSSNLIDVTPKYPELDEFGASVNAASAIIDGELVVLDPDGRPSFELMQQHATQVAFYVFDVLSIDDHDTVGLPYEQRRELVAGLVEAGSNWMVPAHRVGDGRALVDATVERGLEGVMAKRLGSVYVPGKRSPNWRKVKNRHTVEVVIGGYTPGTGNRTSTFGALLVGVSTSEGLRFAGGVGTGFNQRTLAELTARLSVLRTTTCPFITLPPREYSRNAIWVQPELRAEVEIAEFTNEGYVRHSSFTGLVQ